MNVLIFHHSLKCNVSLSSWNAQLHYLTFMYTPFQRKLLRAQMSPMQGCVSDIRSENTPLAMFLLNNQKLIISLANMLQSATFSSFWGADSLFTSQPVPVFQTVHSNDSIPTHTHSHLTDFAKPISNQDKIKEYNTVWGRP